MDTSNITTRICKTCGNSYPLTVEYFHNPKDKNGKRYFQHICVDCFRARDRERYSSKDGAKQMRDWRKKNPEKAKAAKRRSETRHPETVKARKKRSHIRCREKNNKRSLDWHYANKEYSNERNRNNYWDNREERIAQVIQYQKDNPEQFKSVQHRRRALELNAEGDFTAADIAEMYEDQGGHCAYCGIGIFWNIWRDVQIEHIIPLSRGGSNWPDNICLSCRDCNLSKANKTLSEWITTRGW